MSGSSSSAPATTAATATTSTHPTLGKLYEIKCLKDDGSNFQIWSSQIKLVLENRELWEILYYFDRVFSHASHPLMN